MKSEITKKGIEQATHRALYAPAVVGHRGAAGLFHNHGQGRGLVQQAQFACRFIRASGIAQVHIDAAFHQIAVEVGNQGTDVTGAAGHVPLVAAAQIVNKKFPRPPQKL